jgi:signal peptidase I
MGDREGTNFEAESLTPTVQAVSNEVEPDQDSRQQDSSENGAGTEGQGEHVEKLAAKLNRSEKSVKRYQWFVIRLLVVIAVIWVLFFKIVGLTHMPSGDMFPRLDAGDLVLFYRLDTDVDAQDIIVIEKDTPDSNGQKQMFISRVVAKEGDVVDIKNDRLVVNGHTVMEDKIFYPTIAFEGAVSYPVALGPGECFVLADRRDEGADSRFFGPVKQNEIQGKVITIVRRNNL